MKRKDVCFNCGHFYYQHHNGYCSVDSFREDGEFEVCECPRFELYEGNE